MDAKDKERVSRAKRAKSGSEQAAEAASASVQDKLRGMSEKAAPALADNMVAQTLVSALQLMQTNYCGPKTEAILKAIEVGTCDPLEEWGNQILPWTQPALLPSAIESNG